MDAMPETTPVESLEVRELKGVGASFTPHMESALTFKGLLYKPEGEFDAAYQIIAGALLLDSRIISRLKIIIFVPAYSWSTCEVVLVPFKASRHGTRVVQTLQSVQSRFPNVKVFIEWNDLKKRHVVQEVSMSPQDCELIGKVTWPTRDQMLNALQMSAFDNINDLAAANDEIRTLLSAREVE